MRAVVILMAASACSSPSHTRLDAAGVDDANADAIDIDASIDAPIDAAPVVPRRLALAAVGPRTSVRVYVATATSFRKILDVTDPLGPGTGITWADYDKDGRDDLASIFATPNMPGQNEMLIVHNDGSTGMSAAGSRTMNPGLLHGYDAENDGDGDIYVGMQGGPDSLFRSDGSQLPAFYSWSEPGNSAWEAGIASGDMTGDGRPEVVLARGAYGEAIHRGTMGAPSPSWSQLQTGTLESTDAAMIDFDNDGRLDASFSKSNFGQTAGGIEIYRWNGITFVSLASITQLGAIARLDWGDIDGDGDADLATCGPSARLRIYRNDGASFTPNPINSSDLPCVDLAWGDYDIDGDPDLAVTGDGVTVYNNAGSVFTSVFHDGTGSMVLAWGRCGDDSNVCFMSAPTL